MRKWIERFKLWRAKRHLDRLKTHSLWSREYNDLQIKHIELLKSHSSLLSECIALKKELNGRSLVSVTKGDG